MTTATLRPRRPEACLVLPDSPKASAAISRRCLQAVLRDAAGVKPADLSREIDEAMPHLPPYLADAIDAVRNVGNFAAHPVKSRSTGEVVDVEEGEAECRSTSWRACSPLLCRAGCSEGEARPPQGSSDRRAATICLGASDCCRIGELHDQVPVSRERVSTGECPSCAATLRTVRPSASRTQANAWRRSYGLASRFPTHPYGNVCITEMITLRSLSCRGRSSTRTAAR